MDGALRRTAPPAGTAHDAGARLFSKPATLCNVSRGQILIGTSSWTDPTLVKQGNFYPAGAKSAEARLKFYASQFPLVEVDSTYYFPPSEQNAVLWIERTPSDFTFNIKAYSLLTNHPTKSNSLYADVRDSLPEDLTEKRNVYRENLPDEAVEEVWQSFHDALMPLHSAGKLGAILFQFPQWFVISRKSKAYIEECAERLSDFRMAVEFRHKSWMREDNATRPPGRPRPRPPPTASSTTTRRRSWRSGFPRSTRLQPKPARPTSS
jgi:uncharacterized protein YecE (DUF72 family)